MNEHLARSLEDEDMHGSVQTLLSVYLRPRHLADHLVLFVNEIKEFFVHTDSLRRFDGHRHHNGSRLVASRDQIDFFNDFLRLGSDCQIS